MEIQLTSNLETIPIAESKLKSCNEKSKKIIPIPISQSPPEQSEQPYAMPLNAFAQIEIIRGVLNSQRPGTYFHNGNTVMWKSRLGIVKTEEFFDENRLKTHLAYLYEPVCHELIQRAIEFELAKHCPWFYDITDEAAKALLREEPPGTFLMRLSQSQPLHVALHIQGINLAVLLTPTGKDGKWSCLDMADTLSKLPSRLRADATPYSHYYRCQNLKNLSESPLLNVSKTVTKLEIHSATFERHSPGYAFEPFVVEPNSWQEKNVKNLCLSSSQFYGAHSLAKLMSHFPNLESIELIGCQFFSCATHVQLVANENQTIKWKLTDCVKVSRAYTLGGIDTVYSPLVI